MKSFKIPSRNKKTIHKDYFSCPYCNKKFITDDLIEDKVDENGTVIEYHDYYIYNNTMIVHCCDDFVPNVTKDITYKYNGHCKRKDSDK